ncbi:MAG: multidrug effflux MFS transporter [Endozoicomonas sp. (ex Botrylloides leachii)]|nr:multidrug effflux MFS transporter [Endozoicomonas sp. (ex Botrylloides leachii)]
MKSSQSFYFVILIICLSIGGLISTDIFLPALTPMSNFYKTTAHGMQTSISIFLFGISFAQLFYGPLSDSLGRKRVLLIGISVWLLSTAAILFTSTIHELLILRLFQGIGACAGITISRAIISDIFDRNQAGKFYLTIFPFVGMSPAIAPVIGGFLNDYWGWKSCFIFLMAFVSLTLLLCCFILNETHPKEKRKRFSVSCLLTNTYKVISDSNFLYFAAIPCFAYATYFAYIVESPFILTNLGLKASNIGYTFFTLSLTYVAGNITAKRILKKLDTERTISLGYIIFLIGGGTFALQMCISPNPIITSILSISILTFGNGFLLPLGTAQAIASRPDLSGTASGVMGFLQLGSAAISSLLIGIISGHQAEKTAIMIFLLSAFGFLIYSLGIYKKTKRKTFQGNTL